MRFMSKDSKELKAAIFLLDSRPVAEKESQFREAFSEEYKWFTEFIIGENHLRNGDRNKALEAFQRSDEVIPKVEKGVILTSDGWLIGQVKARLRQLSGTDEQIVENEQE